MHRVTGGGPLLLQRRAEVMDAYSLLQHSHPALPPDLHDFQVCCLKTCLPSEWHWKYDNCRPTSSPPLLTRRIGTTSSPVCLLAWAKLCPCCSQASSFHRVIFFGHVPITTCSFKVRRRWLLRHSPQSSFSWRPTVRSLDFQLLSETRYCEMDLVITSVALPPLWAFWFSAPASRFGEAAVEASICAHSLRRVLGVNWGTFKAPPMSSQNQY